MMAMSSDMQIRHVIMAMVMINVKLKESFPVSRLPGSMGQYRIISIAVFDFIGGFPLSDALYE